MKEGPLWQLQQNLKHHRSLAQTFRSEANVSMKRAEDADLMAAEYEKAIEKLTGEPA